MGMLYTFKLSIVLFLIYNLFFRCLAYFTRRQIKKNILETNMTTVKTKLKKNIHIVCLFLKGINQTLKKNLVLRIDDDGFFYLISTLEESALIP